MAVPAVLLGAAAKSANWDDIANHTKHVRWEDQGGVIHDPRLTLPLVLQFLTPPWGAFIGEYRKQVNISPLKKCL